MNSKRVVAEQALEAIEQLLNEGRPLEAKDDEWIVPLQSVLGRGPVSLVSPNSLHETIELGGEVTRETIEKERAATLTILRDTLRAMLAATDYQPTIRAFDGYTLTIHNSRIAKELKAEYSADEFEQLLTIADHHGVFRIAIDEKTGIGMTAGSSAAEDSIMAQRWVTDAVRFGDLERPRHPEAWQRTLNTLARFYALERAAFEECIAHPDRYRDLNSRAGVHHMFSPDTLERYPWLTSKRLESHGLALWAFCEAILAAKDNVSWALTDVSDDVVQSLVWLTKFFKAIEYETAPSNGPWERDSNSRWADVGHCHHRLGPRWFIESALCARI
jgi:hypothetical protein